MHTNVIGIGQIPGENVGLDSRQSLQARNNHVAGVALFAQHPVQAEMPGFAGEQGAVKRTEIWIRTVLSQQGHALMAASLDQTCHEE